ncbi:MAG: hypothetical protein M5R42_09705 [Rhodocyclaceae bacterium]|nr:hypothetical protein [Rhodocyclaceae bacterium]
MKMSSRISAQWHSTLTGLAILVLLSAGTGHAGDNSDHERARQTVEAGEVLPLRTILERVEREITPGQIMEVELDRKKANGFMKSRYCARMAPWSS